jgi:hypothetical protein
MREAKDLSSNQSGGDSYLCICAFAHLRICVARAPIKPPKNNKYTEDTIRWQLFRNDLL